MFARDCQPRSRCSVDMAMWVPPEALLIKAFEVGMGLDPKAIPIVNLETGVLCWISRDAEVVEACAHVELEGES